MPITGGLNSTKGIIRCENGAEKCSFDRPDVLIAESGIDGYCKDVYLIDDKKMVERFVNSAKEPIFNLAKRQVV